MVQKKVRLRLLVAAIITLQLFAKQLSACDMMALVAKGDYNLNDLDVTSLSELNSPKGSPNSYLEFLISRSQAGLNKTGYGVIFYKNSGQFYFDQSNRGINDNQPGDPANQAWYLLGENNTDYAYSFGGDKAWPLNRAISVLTNGSNNSNAKIILGHDRNASLPFVKGNHPFRFEYDGKTYSLMHNGGLGETVKSRLYDKLLAEDSDWWNNHPSNWNTSTYVDTEIFFHWVMLNVMKSNGSLLQGLRKSFTTIIDNTTNKTLHDYLTSISLNFIVTDGETVYVFRGTDYNSNYPTQYNLSYKKYDKFWGVKTQETTENLLKRYQLLCLSPYFNLETIIPSFSYPANTTALIPQLIDATVNNGVYDIVSQPNVLPIRAIDYDLTIDGGATVTIKSEVSLQTMGKCNINILNGTLIIENGASLDLAQHSNVVVDGPNAKLEVRAGGKISGYAQNVKIAGQYGDRVIARNGGKLQIGETGNPLRAQIYSRSASKWAGFEIQAASIYDDSYQFKNCNISGIDNIYIKGQNSTQQILIDNCTITNTNGIIADNVKMLEVKNSIIDNSGSNGISLYSSGANITNNTIQNCYLDGIDARYLSIYPLNINSNTLQNNRGNGLSLYSCKINDITGNQIKNNGQRGISAWDCSINNENAKIKQNTVSDNGAIEFAGKYDDLKRITGSGNYIADRLSTGGDDRYILSILGLISSADKPVDVSGNTFPQQGSIDRFAPSYSCYYFGSGTLPISPAKEAYESALESMSEAEYEQARSGFTGVIANYPEAPEAAAAVNSLLNLELIDRGDYPQLRSYLNTLPAQSPVELASAVKDVGIGSYLCEKDYNTALPLLENKINTASQNEIKVNALLDQAYCEYSLLTSGNKAAADFDRYTIKLKTAADFADAVSRIKAGQQADNTNPQEVVDKKVILEHSSYPNPFNPETHIKFKLNTGSQISLTVYNITGQKVAELYQGSLPAGEHSFKFNSQNYQLASGIYYYRLTGDFGTATARIMLLK